MALYWLNSDFKTERLQMGDQAVVDFARAKQIIEEKIAESILLGKEDDKESV